MRAIALAVALTGLAACTGPAPYEAVRLGDAPIIDQGLFEALGVPEEGANINGPSLIRVPDWIPPAYRAHPTALYYLYFAHHRGDYIRLAWAKDLAGPWHLVNTGLGVPVGARGVLDLGPSDSIPLAHGLTIEEHIASPDVFVDDRARRIVMFFHAPVDAPSYLDQRTLVATSADGLDFNGAIEPAMLGKSYFRVFPFGEELFALGFRGSVYRAPDPSAPWTPAPGFPFGTALWQWEGNPFQENIALPATRKRARHFAVRVVGDQVHVLLSRVGDVPERIRFATLVPDGTGGWIASDPPLEVLAAEPGWECGELPPLPSESGAAPEQVNQLRDPAFFQDADGSMYLLYTGCGEDAIGIAALTPR